MKPMLKNIFFTTVKQLAAAGRKPHFYTICGGKSGLLAWDVDGVKHVEELFSTTYESAPRMIDRFNAWFVAAMGEYHAAAAEALKVGDRVLDGDDERTVTGFRTVAPRDSIGNKTNGVCARTGVIVLDGTIEVMAGDVWPHPDVVEEMADRKTLREFLNDVPAREPTAEEQALADLLNAGTHAPIKPNEERPEPDHFGNLHDALYELHGQLHLPVYVEVGNTLEARWTCCNEDFSQVVYTGERTAEAKRIAELANREAVQDWNAQQAAEQAAEARNERYFEDRGWMDGMRLEDEIRARP